MNYDNWRQGGAWEDDTYSIHEDVCGICGKPEALDVRLNATSDGVLCDICLEKLRNDHTTEDDDE